MNGTQGNEKVFKLNIDGGIVFLRFAKEESIGLKTQLRDILTSAYDERFLQYINGDNPSASE